MTTNTTPGAADLEEEIFQMCVENYGLQEECRNYYQLDSRYSTMLYAYRRLSGIATNAGAVRRILELLLPTLVRAAIEHRQHLNHAVIYGSGYQRIPPPPPSPPQNESQNRDAGGRPPVPPPPPPPPKRETAPNPAPAPRRTMPRFTVKP